jgi:acetolactate synthase-1/2/3 large subunit
MAAMIASRRYSLGRALLERHDVNAGDGMDGVLNRRQFLAASAAPASGAGVKIARAADDGAVRGKMTGAQAIAAALVAEGCGCVFGIPGAQENELWDVFKQIGVPYLLAAHEFSAACMADGWARSTGRPGVLAVVPGPGLTNALSGLGEALLDSVPIVCIVGDIANGKHYRPFQVHSLPTVELLKPVTKAVFAVEHAADAAAAIRRAFHCAASGEPGPVGVAVPYNLLAERVDVCSPPLAVPEAPFDADAAERAFAILADRKRRVGIYAGFGCMDAGPLLTEFAEMLQAPVATSVSGKGVIDECHPLAVGWGFGPQATETAERIFRREVDVVLAVGVKFSEVSTGFYSIKQPECLIHVDANPCNLGQVYRSSVCVAADAGVFFRHGLDRAEALRRPPNPRLHGRIADAKSAERRGHAKLYAKCAADPMAFLLSLRKHACMDAMLFVDVTASEHWAAEVFTTRRPRAYFNPTDNQSMGWSIPAALGAQRAFPCRQTIAVLGDGCFLMSAMELSTAAREGLPVKWFVLDDQAYHYMQALQKAAYLRTTATMLARLDYPSLAQGLGVEYAEICTTGDLDAGVQAALAHPGPLLCRVKIDYRDRPIRWLEAVRGRFIQELSMGQKARFLARLGTRALDLRPENND